MQLRGLNPQSFNPELVARALANLANGSWADSATMEAKGDGTLGVKTSGIEAFPIGSVFISVVATNPGTLLGYGTWVAFGAGKVMVGLDSGDVDFDTAEETGGAKTVTSTGSVAAPTISGSTAAEAAHTHSVTSNVAVANHSFTQPTIAWPAGVPTAANESAHTHGIGSYVAANESAHTHGFTATGTVSAIAQSATAAVAVGTGAANAASRTHTHPAPTFTGGSDTSGAGSAHTHTLSGTSAAGSAHTHTLSWPAGVPTASGGAVDAHAVTNNAVTSGAGSSHLHAAGTLAASAPAYTGNATSVVQPYIVCRFWKRTA